jgi:hypothetical protein
MTANEAGEARARHIVGAVVFAIGTGLAAAPWWSARLPASDYPLVWALGAIFAGIGLYAALPETRLPRLRSLALVVFMGAFGTVCAALAFAPLAVDRDGRYTIGGVAGFSGGPIPWWARIVAAFFALVCIGTAALGVWGLLRGLFGREDERPLR